MPAAAAASSWAVATSESVGPREIAHEIRVSYQPCRGNPAASEGVGGAYSPSVQVWTMYSMQGIA
jgi:hypothetical protein